MLDKKIEQFAIKHAEGQSRLNEGLEVCCWQQWTDDCGIYDTDCGGSFTIEEGTPKENMMKYCCYCGKPLVTSNV